MTKKKVTKKKISKKKTSNKKETCPIEIISMSPDPSWEEAIFNRVIEELAEEKGKTKKKKNKRSV